MLKNAVVNKSCENSCLHGNSLLKDKLEYVSVMEKIKKIGSVGEAKSSG